MKFTKLLKITIVALIIIFTVDAGLIFTMANWQPEAERADAVVVLGAAINTPALTRRTLDGLQLYEQGKADRLILSGGKIADSDISEAEFMYKVITSNTANPIDYIIEDQSRNTYENIKNSKAKLIESERAERMLNSQDELSEAEIMENSSVIIVSDKYHLARAVLLAKRAGFETVHWHSPDPYYYPKQELHYYYFREFVAILSYIPKFIFG
ncbi:YdcF family protein [bacterium]|nr:MAG: YdcF family protein [bacterium]